jgi:hypothetical protein
MQKDWNLKERRSRAAKATMDENTQHLQELNRTAASEGQAADAEAKQAATRAAEEAEKALENAPPPGVKVFKIGTEESLTKGIAARAAAQAAGVKVKWRVEIRAAEIVYEQSKSAYERASREAAAAKETMDAETLAEQHAAYVARAAEAHYCCTWLEAMERSQLSESLETLIAKWFSDMFKPREVLWRLIRSDLRFCYGPGLKDVPADEVFRRIRERLEQLGMSATDAARLELRMSVWHGGSGSKSTVVVLTGPMCDGGSCVTDSLDELKQLISTADAQEPAILDTHPIMSYRKRWMNAQRRSFDAQVCESE